MAAADPHAPQGVFRTHPLVAVPLALAGLAAWWMVSGPAVWQIAVPWVPSHGIDLAFRLDGLAVQMLTLISVVGVAVFVYGSAYLAGHPRLTRLFGLLTAFMVAMAGCVTTDNLVVLFVFWELTSVTSFLLIGFEHERESTRRSAQQALLVTASGGLALLAGVILIGLIADTYSIQVLIERAPALLDHPLLPAALICVFVGAFTKSAQWPFLFWLPNAMAAPTPVSAYLHSATMVKLGIYLLARLKPAFGTLLLWEVTLVSIGAITAVWAMVLVLREYDMKRILAWSTVSALGTLVLLVGLPGAGAAEATAALLLAHALYKAPLFFVAGNIDHTAGTRDINKLAAMGRVMPWTALVALLAGLSMAGVPLSMGHVAKDSIAIAKTEGLAFEWVSYTTFLASVISVAVASVAAIRIFWHRGGEGLPADMHEAPARMIVPPLALAALGIVFGVIPSMALPFLRASARAMLRPGERDLVTAASEGGGIGSTLLIFGLGLLVFLSWDRLHSLMARLRWPDYIGFAVVYDRTLHLIPAAARALTSRVQPGSLPAYVAVVAATSALALAAALVAAGDPTWPGWVAPSVPVAGAAVVILGASVAACLVRDPFVLLLVSGMAGLGTALFCLFIGAPDVAFTQFAVEVAFVVVVAAVVRRVHALSVPGGRTPSVAGRLVVSLALGGLITILTVLAAGGPASGAAAAYFSERSLTEAFGRNVVNVIIVDFRALDTLGEITVVAITFMAVLPLLRQLTPHRGDPSEDV